MQLVIGSTGSITCVYDEAIDLAELGRLEITRASHVEPDENGRWTADMSPVAGPVLGPFDQRSQALDAERQWLEARWLLNPEADRDMAARFKSVLILAACLLFAGMSSGCGKDKKADGSKKKCVKLEMGKEYKKNTCEGDK